MVCLEGRGCWWDERGRGRAHEYRRERVDEESVHEERVHEERKTG
jgi:hypothetical protein